MGGGAFLPNFQESLFLALNYTLGTNFVPISGIIIFSLELYLGDQLYSKCTKKSFVSYSVNEI